MLKKEWGDRTWIRNSRFFIFFIWLYLAALNPILLRRLGESEHHVVVHRAVLAVLVLVHNLLDKVAGKGDQKCLEDFLFTFNHDVSLYQSLPSLLPIIHIGYVVQTGACNHNLTFIWRQIMFRLVHRILHRDSNTRAAR